MAENKNLRPFEEFEEHIQNETQKARNQLSEWIDNPNVTSVGCVDKLTGKGVVNPPGGLVFLYADQSSEDGGNYPGLVGQGENLLEGFVRARAQAGVKDGVLMAHLNCGYMRVVLKKDKLPSQANIIRQAVGFLNELNINYHTNFQVVIEKQGSATPYMKKG